MNKIKDQLSAFADVEEKISLKTKTTFRIGGTCAYFVYPKDVISLMKIVELIKENQLPYKVFGKGSNLLCSDDDFNGVIICLDRYMNQMFFCGNKAIVEAGASIIYFALECAKHALSGMEFASGIPATVGGCLFMNAGAYKSDMSQVVKRICILKNGKLEWMDAKDAAFAYRKSIFQERPDWIIVACEIELKESNEKEIRSLMDSRKQRRMESQPLDKPCAGSIFRNPEGQAAWKLIEDAGLRGKRIGGAMVSNKHANFIVNENNATALDVLTLIELIQMKIKELYGIDLHAEVERFNWKI